MRLLLRNFQPFTIQQIPCASCADLNINNSLETEKMKKLITICAAIVLFGTGYARAGTWTTLDYPGAYQTVARGISGDSIVGIYNDGSGSPSHGFIYEIPEPATLLLLGFGAVRLRSRQAVMLRRKRS